MPIENLDNDDNEAVLLINSLESSVVKTFDSFSDLKNTSEVFEVGDYIATREGFVYSVEDPDTSDYHVLTTNGTRLYIANQDRITPRMAGLVTYDTSVANDSQATDALANKTIMERLIDYAFKNMIPFVLDDDYICAPNMTFTWTDEFRDYVPWSFSGEGKGTITFYTTANFTHGMKFIITPLDYTHEVARITFRDFVLRLPSRNYTGHGMHFLGGVQMELHRIRFHHFDGSALLCEGVWDSRFVDLMQQNCGSETNSHPGFHFTDCESHNTNSLRILNCHSEKSWYHEIAVGGTQASESQDGGGAKHIRLMGNKAHEKPAGSGTTANLYIYGPNTRSIVVVGEQYIPCHVRGIWIDEGARDVTVIGCEIGQCNQPIRIEDVAGPGHKFIDNSFEGRGGTHYIFNLSEHPIYVSGNYSYGEGSSGKNTDYKEAKVNEVGASGTSLDIDGLEATPAVDDRITISGITGEYIVTAVGSYVAPSEAGAYDGSATLTLNRSLSSSPSDDASVTFTTRLDEWDELTSSIDDGLAIGLLPDLLQLRTNGTDPVRIVDARPAATANDEIHAVQVYDIDYATDNSLRAVGGLAYEYIGDTDHSLISVKGLFNGVYQALMQINADTDLVRFGKTTKLRLTNAAWSEGNGLPSGGNNGDFYTRLDGGAGSTFYVKEAGSWVAK